MIRFLWLIEKQFDVAPDTATWLEMASNLQHQYNLILLTGYRHRKIQPDLLRNNILYYNSAKVPALHVLLTNVSECRLFSHAASTFRPHVVTLNCSNHFLLRYAVSVKKRLDFKVIFDVRSLPVGTGQLRRYIYDELFSLNLRWAARHFDGITYITEEMRRFCIRTHDLPTHPSVVWTSGVDPQLFCPESHATDGGPFRILYHGTIAKKRRLDNILKALPLIEDVHVRLEFLGEGDALPELKDLARRLGVGERVVFHNAVSYREVPRWINRCHAGILPFPNWPGWNTSSPIKLFEYLSCSKPVIVTRIPAHQNVLHGHDFAFWAEEGSPKAIANAIRRANSERSRFDILGRKAREHVMKKYTWKQQASKMQDFIEHILNRG